MNDTTPNSAHSSSSGQEPAIELIDVHKRFGRQEVLRGINLTIYEGRTLVIVGASGQGKSVIIKHMLGLIRPDHGSVRVFGQDLNRVRSNRLNDIRENFGVLFQNAALFDSMNVYDNVALPLRERTRSSAEEIRRNVEEKLDLMDLTGSEDKFPAQLSGGMRKRVGLARALVLKPKIVFFDEPTTGLDVSKSNEIYRLFHRTQQQLGYTAVIVSHDAPKIFKLADEVALLADGVIQECLTPVDFQLSTQPMVRAFVEETMGRLYRSDTEEDDLYAQI